MFGIFGFASNQRRKTRKAKASNRRIAAERQPLDKKPETPKIRQKQKEERRRKGLQWVAGMVVGMSLIGLGNTAIQEALFKNPRFSLRQVHVQTEGILTPAEIIHATGLVNGVNLLTVNLHDVRARLEHLPGVKGATVQRDFQGRLAVAVLQRQPIAWVRCEKQHWIPHSVGQSLMVDSEGVAFPADTLLPEFRDLPVIADEELKPIVLGEKIQSDRFQVAMRLLKMLNQRHGQGGERVVNISTPNKFALLTKFANGAEVTFSHDDVDGQMQRYDLFLSEARRKKWEFEKLNLVAATNTPVVFKSQPGASGVSAALLVAPPSTAQRTSSKGGASKSSSSRSQSR